MNRQNYKIHIIGAGISGLIAAKTLEQHGYKPTIIEATNSVGGRVKTDVVDDYQLDRGFQVLLNAYPKAIEHLDFNKLDLQEFLPGATIFLKGKQQTIGDPLRNLSLLLPTLSASIGNFSDKLKILKLNSALKKKSIESIFESKAMSTFDYLKGKGFSDAIIAKFFRPFFSGIFLEPDLKTSSRMFEFVYKMFGEGLAVLPKSGIGAISEQLKSQLKRTDFIFNTKVKSVNDRSIRLSNGNTIDTDFSIITSGASYLIDNLNNQDINWKSCYNLYFETENKTISKPLIGLVADGDSLINNIFYHNSLETTQTGTKELLSVTVVKSHDLDEKALTKRVEAELASKCDIYVSKHLKTYYIKQALPDIDDLQYDISPTETQIKPTIFLAGDYLLNGSLNAAMISGERAAQGVIMSLEDGLVVENLTSEYI
ncbi:MAG: NAD(P)-binding protein [Winogradskyella sp.]|uniref:NAD(P)/FAD-dependent oxidoreductase n=1 Tax=Winogradskyella sp. TaxID=1883156 RepID=UPI00180C8D38|nr:NAD(P)/FAD-dependent oxidoreductase [Winogradskyella sp.]MBT8244273.1 FAD-dependent oxidoreductase [Winogradskyella sp.]NNK23242.1 NAD(P)-binding protein [Winogradskyella sp.]